MPATTAAGGASDSAPAAHASGGVPVKSSAAVHVLKGAGPQLLYGYLEQGQLKGAVGTVVRRSYRSCRPCSVTREDGGSGML